MFEKLREVVDNGANAVLEVLDDIENSEFVGEVKDRASDLRVRTTRAYAAFTEKRYTPDSESSSTEERIPGW
jgi:hypothetical protein